MAPHHPQAKKPIASYFYLPSLNGKSAEIILVTNAISPTIQIPVPEEDLQLHAFFQRDMTDAEIMHFGATSTWRIFTNWFHLKSDHKEYEINEITLAQLMKFKYNRPLRDTYIAVA